MSLTDPVAGEGGRGEPDPPERPLVTDGGSWRGIELEDWLARFCGRDDRHAGARPIVVGLR